MNGFSKRSANDLMWEVAHQLLICELCFEQCSRIWSLPIHIRNGRGVDLMCFFYNLMFSKGINSMHSLLLSKGSEELLINNYATKRCEKSCNCSLCTQLDSFVQKARSLFEKHNFRHKVTAHLDAGYMHSGFLNAYAVPGVAQECLAIVKELKVVFFVEHNISQDNEELGFDKIYEQCASLIELLSKPQ